MRVPSPKAQRPQARRQHPHGPKQRGKTAPSSPIQAPRNGEASAQRAPLSLQRALELNSLPAQVVELCAIFAALVCHVTGSHVAAITKEDYAKRLDHAFERGWVKRRASIRRSNGIRNAIVHRAVDKPFPSVSQMTAARDEFAAGIRKLAAKCEPGIRERVLGGTKHNASPPRGKLRSSGTLEAPA